METSNSGLLESLVWKECLEVEGVSFEVEVCLLFVVLEEFAFSSLSLIEGLGVLNNLVVEVPETCESLLLASLVLAFPDSSTDISGINVPSDALADWSNLAVKFMAVLVALFMAVIEVGEVKTSEE